MQKKGASTEKGLIIITRAVVICYINFIWQIEKDRWKKLKKKLNTASHKRMIKLFRTIQFLNAVLMSAFENKKIVALWLASHILPRDCKRQCWKRPTGKATEALQPYLVNWEIERFWEKPKESSEINTIFSYIRYCVVHQSEALCKCYQFMKSILKNIKQEKSYMGRNDKLSSSMSGNLKKKKKRSVYLKYTDFFQLFFHEGN